MQTSVYPREIVKHALALNAAAVIFAHNHPSGVAEPSRADEVLTANLKRALALVDVQVLDQFVVGVNAAVSFHERGMNNPLFLMKFYFRREGNRSFWTDPLLWCRIIGFAEFPRGKRYVTRLSGDRQEADGGAQCVSRQQQNQTPFSA